jgi:hypothetical protein
MPVTKEGRELFVLSGSHMKGMEEVLEKPNEGACSLFIGGRGLWQILLFHPLLFHAGTRGWKSFNPDDDPSSLEYTAILEISPGSMARLCLPGMCL